MRSEDVEVPKIEVQFEGTKENFKINTHFTFPSRGITALFGPSGCGKTTILRCIAGLNRLNGKLRIGAETWQDSIRFIPTHKRAIGYVFQEASLFPHLTVKQNLLFGQKRALSKTAGPTFDEITSLMGLDALLNRSPDYLSGGERQRVAIGRALLTSPKLLLMDEPLSGLDLAAKDEIITYLDKLHEALKIPILFVSHDIREVERLADHMVLMEKGHVRAQGPLLDLLNDPTLPFASADDAATILEGRVITFDPTDHLSELSIQGGTLFVPGKIGEIGETRRLRISASDISLSVTPPSRTTILNIIEAKITSIQPISHGKIGLLLSLSGEDGAQLISHITQRSFNNLEFKLDQKIFVQIKGVSMIKRLGT
ncbi:MAG: molybdenum ABC transporter ATP-binding protein [Sneathiella sp.]